MDIKEIALRLLAEEFPGMRQENQAFMVEFAEAIIESYKAELLNGVGEPVDVEPAMWVMKHIRSGDLAQAKPNQKALHPYMLSDAFPRYTTPQPDRVTTKESYVELDIHSNPSRTEQQRKLDGSLEVGQLLGNGQNQETSHSKTVGDIILTDTFRGDDSALIDSIVALVSLDRAGVLVPHGIGGHARSLLESAAIHLSQPDRTAELELFRQQLAAKDEVIAEAGEMLAMRDSQLAEKDAEVEKLKRLNSSYSSLTKAQEGQLTALRNRLYELRSADKTLDSEREANAILTEQLAALKAENESLRKDAERLDWVEHQDFYDLSFAMLVDQPNDGMIAVSIGEGWHLGNNLREAIDAAIASVKGEQI